MLCGLNGSLPGRSIHMPGKFRFSFGPWNIHEGADPFGPAVREPFTFDEKLCRYKELGFDAVQFHDDDIVPADLDRRRPSRRCRRSPRSRRCSTAQGSSPRSSPPASGRTPGRSTAASPPTTPATASTRSTAPRRCVGHRPRGRLQQATSSGWPARGPTSARPRTPTTAVGRIVDASNAMLEHDQARSAVLGEAKPNEPMDQAYLPTVGHMPWRSATSTVRSRRARAC